MESMMFAHNQNHAQAQNHYDSFENSLKKGVLWPIFPAGSENQAPPTLRGPPSYGRARGSHGRRREFMVGCGNELGESCLRRA
jgi:hypothetical protein